MKLYSNKFIKNFLPFLFGFFLMIKIVKEKQRVKKSQCPSVGTEVKISSSERFESI